jgi:4-hydroxy-tetrahydrodipicolinate reductase
MMNIMLSGANGKMGRVIARLVEDMDDARISAGVDINEKPYGDFAIYPNPADCTEHADVMIDFSNPAALDKIVAYAIKNSVPAVVATTGLSQEQIDSLKAAAKYVPIFFSPNMSLGVNLLVGLVKKAAEILYEGFDIEIIEKHHNQKIDAPSGTALVLADAICSVLPDKMECTSGRSNKNQKRKKNEIGIHAVRGGTIVGEHQVIFAGTDEIVELRHSAQSKEIFAVGAIRAARFLKDKPNGFYTMKDLIE